MIVRRNTSAHLLTPLNYLVNQSLFWGRVRFWFWLSAILTSPKILISKRIHRDTSNDSIVHNSLTGVKYINPYPYHDATLIKAGEVHDIGIVTPHESLPVTQDFNRQLLRIISAGVHGREEYFTLNPLVWA